MQRMVRKQCVCGASTMEHPAMHVAQPVTLLHVPGLDIARCVATARIVMPRTVVRLSAGRLNFSFADQVGRCCSRSVQLGCLVVRG
jgi:biotin synthase-like enzyme